MEITPSDQHGPLHCDLRILATTDLHVQINPHDYFADRPAPGTGLATLAGLIKEQRAEAVNCLLLDNGDFLQGNPMGDLAAMPEHRATGRPHPMIAAMNQLCYDAAALGNHDLNYGLPFLRDTLARAQFPLVCANLLSQDGQLPLFTPVAVLDRELVCADGCRVMLRIAVMGFVPPQVTIWDKAHLDGHATARGIVETARATIAQARSAGADIVIGLCHSGIGCPEEDPMAENAALALAGLGGIDAVVAGHSHLVFPGPDFAERPGADIRHGLLAGKPAVMPGFSGSHLGVIDLRLTRFGAERWKVAQGRGRVLRGSPLPPAPARPPCPELIRLTAADHSDTLALLRQPCGQTSSALHSYFALCGDSLSVRLVAMAQRHEVAETLRHGPYSTLPVLSASAPFRCGGRGGLDNYTDLAAGALLQRHLADLCPYPNTLVALRVTGAELRDWLTHATAIFSTVLQDAVDQPLLMPQVPSYNFDLIEGLTYRIDLSRPPGADRVRDLRFDGEPLNQKAEFIVATNSYRAAGGGGFIMAGAAPRVLERPITVREVLRRYLAKTGPFHRPQGSVWQLSGAPGSTAIFETGPDALRHALPPGTETAGLSPAGFLRLRLRF